MNSNLFIYNTLSRKKEKFEPYNPPFAGIYVCGPTVYSDPHLGHARVNIVFDTLYRYLSHLGYRVRYVRNITDVGHLENEETDTGEDKITRQARQEHLEPMEVVQQYMNSFHKNMSLLNVLEPSIEPRATGHIIEQQEMISRLIEKGFAYESGGSVYFDVEKYNSKYNYGILSGRVLEDLVSNTRQLEGQSQKKSSFDFALWKKAAPEHIMKWPSEWSEGFPGWHLECSAMSLKYLGQPFDIHGGGMDLMFPHHECEIAQSTAILDRQPVKYWMHNNMITINGQKMARSLNNFITLQQLFTGQHDALEMAYSPMTIRFFILQAHYRSTLDFSNEALQASEKGLTRLMKAVETLESLKGGDNSTVNVEDLGKKCYAALDDDLNTPVLISHLFDGVKIINSVADGRESISVKDIETLKKLYGDVVFDILGLTNPGNNKEAENDSDRLMDLLLEVRSKAKLEKDWATSDMIRDALKELGIEIKDTKDGTSWEKKK